MAKIQSAINIPNALSIWSPCKCNSWIFHFLCNVHPDRVSFQSSGTQDGLPFVKLYFVKNYQTNTSWKINNVKEASLFLFMLPSLLDCKEDLFLHILWLLKFLGISSHLAKRVSSPDLLRIIRDEKAHSVCHNLDSAGVYHDLGLLGWNDVLSELGTFYEQHNEAPSESDKLRSMRKVIRINSAPHGAIAGLFLLSKLYQ